MNSEPLDTATFPVDAVTPTIDNVSSSNLVIAMIEYPTAEAMWHYILQDRVPEMCSHPPTIQPIGRYIQV